MPASLGLFFTLLVVALLIALAASARASARFRFLLCTALLLRVVGAFAYYVTATKVYGKADAQLYLRDGVAYAAQIWQGDFSMFSDLGSHFWGTGFVSLLTGVTSAVVGPGFIANNIVYSMAAFGGLYAMASAFRRSYPTVPVARYARWIWLFPSLWFWPAGIGKDAILLLGFGLAMNGFVGDRGRVRWPSFLVGCACMFAIRPQVMAVVVFSMVFAQWMSRERRWSFARVVQALLFVVAAVVLIRVALQHVGIEDTQGVSDYLAERATHTAAGRSAVTSVGTNPLAAPFAAFNVLFRPLPWDVASVTGALAMLEIYAFWFFAFRRRANIRNALRHWRSERFLSASLAFTLIYATILGMVIVNLGIIARQRTVLFPCMFLFLEALPAAPQGPNALDEAVSLIPVEEFVEPLVLRA